MASLIGDEKRNVVPNWRDYNKTAKLGEFGGVAVVTNPLKLFPIDEYVVSWENNRSIPYAGDLVSAAILNEQQTNPAAIDAAKFIILHNLLCVQFGTCWNDINFGSFPSSSAWGRNEYLYGFKFCI